MSDRDTITWSCDWRTYLRGPEAPRTWRDRLARWLRRRADGLDRRHSYAVEVYATGGLTAGDLNAAVVRGMAHAHDLLTEECRCRALDAALLQSRPYLAGAADEPARRIAP